MAEKIKQGEAVEIVTGEKRGNQGTHANVEHSVTEKDALHKDTGKHPEKRDPGQAAKD